MHTRDGMFVDAKVVHNKVQNNVRCSSDTRPTCGSKSPMVAQQTHVCFLFLLRCLWKRREVVLESYRQKRCYPLTPPPPNWVSTPPSDLSPSPLPTCHTRGARWWRQRSIWTLWLNLVFFGGGARGEGIDGNVHRSKFSGLGILELGSQKKDSNGMNHFSGASKIWDKRPSPPISHRCMECCRMTSPTPTTKLNALLCHLQK